MFLLFSRIMDTITKMSSTWCVLDSYSLAHQNARHEFIPWWSSAGLKFLWGGPHSQKFTTDCVRGKDWHQLELPAVPLEDHHQSRLLYLPPMELCSQAGVIQVGYNFLKLAILRNFYLLQNLIIRKPQRITAFKYWSEQQYGINKFKWSFSSSNHKWWKLLSPGSYFDYYCSSKNNAI
jgi:hypothetical protein